MSLLCDCDIDYCPEPGDTIWYPPADYSTLSTTRRKRCCSCKELIDVGALVAEFPRYKVPEWDIEERIYGEDGEIPRASFHMCESCADIYFSIKELDYCFDDWDMRAVLKEYHQLKKGGLLL